MSEKNIYKVNKNYKITKSIDNTPITFGLFNSLEDAVFIRNLLIDTDWRLDDIQDVYEADGYFFVVGVIDERVHLLAKYKKKPNQTQIDKLVEKQIRNPHNSRYGLNISKVFDVFIVKKQIAGDEYIFGYYDDIDDAVFVRNFLMDHEWNVNAFNNIEKDDKNQYKCIKIIDDKVCILNTFGTKKEALKNYDESYDEFISKIYKNKHGFASYPHLDAFSEIKFETTLKDDNWDLNQLESKSAKDLIFNLTPWQKIIYDAVGDEIFSFDELKESLKRYRSRNFDKKIQKHLDELIKLDLINDLGNNNYKKL